MRALAPVTVWVAWLLVACGPSGTGGADGGQPPGDGQVLPDGQGTFDGQVLPDGQVVPDGQASPDGGGPGPDATVSTTEYCLPTCATPADCNLGSAPYDADNYQCTGGVCAYQGCNSDTECAALGNYLCRAATGSSVPYCYLACTTATDCDLGGGAAYDADNYQCAGSVCEYQGCNSDAECQTLGSYECAPGTNPLQP